MRSGHRGNSSPTPEFSMKVGVRDKPLQFDMSFPRLMTRYWASDVQIQFGKLSNGGFMRPADKEDIARIVNRLHARLTGGDPYLPFAWTVLKHFKGNVISRRRGGVVALQFWLVRMIRDLALAEDMTAVANRFPNRGLLDGLHVSTAQTRRNMAAAGFGELAKKQLRACKGRRPTPITLPVPPANTQEEEDAA